MRHGAWARACAAILLAGAPAFADQITEARLTEATTRYAHGVFGDDITYGALVLTVAACAGCASREVTFSLPQTRVFEDHAARVADLDGDGQAEVIVVETDLALGASLAIYGSGGKRAATDVIGQTRRWLAPAGVGDFDGDGRAEIAYVDRPHLARELVFLRYDQGKVTEVARVSGLTNHRFGDAEISGGVRRCEGRDSVIVASRDWSRVVEVVLQGAAPVLHDRGPISGMAAAMGCP